MDDIDINFQLQPSSFFSFIVDCYPANFNFDMPFDGHTISDLAPLNFEISFAKVAIGYSPEGLVIKLAVKDLALKSAELFIDTRDIKNSGFAHRFCHHFCVQVEENKVAVGSEVTHFRTDDKHEPADDKHIRCQISGDEKLTILAMLIEAQGLYGYDPATLDRLGFTYRLTTTTGEQQHFSVSSKEFTIEQQPSMWATLKLIKEV